MVGCDLHNTSKLDHPVEIGSVSRAWSQTTGFDFLSPVVLSEDYVVVAGGEGIVGLSKADGQAEWHATVPGNVGGGPAICNGHVVVPRDPLGEGFGDANGIDRAHLYGVAPGSDELSRDVRLEGRKAYSAVSDEHVVALTSTGIYSITNREGVVWSHEFRRPADEFFERIPPLRPAVGFDAVFSPCPDCICRLDRASGELAWERDVPGVAYSPTLTERGTVVISSESRTVALDAATGEIAWSVDEGSYYSPAVTDSTLVVPFPGVVRGLDAATGDVLWETGFRNLTAPPVVAGDVAVLVGGRRGRIVDVTDGSTVETFATDGVVQSLAPSPRGVYTVQQTGDALEVAFLDWSR